MTYFQRGAARLTRRSKFKAERHRLADRQFARRTSAIVHNGVESATREWGLSEWTFSDDTSL